MSFFLTGTDTGIGKTTTAGLLLLRCPWLLYWKPIQTGEDFDRVSIERQLGPNLNKERLLPESYHFAAPLSPYRAAECEGRSVAPKKILADLRENEARGSLLIEGAGGLLVPLTRNYTWLDFLIEARLPVIIAARTALGTINHSLLTVKALQQHEIPILGLVFCGPRNEDNRRTVADISGVPVICSFDTSQDRDWSQISMETSLLRDA